MPNKPTIEFTYDKNTKVYCFGFWIKGKFVTRMKSNKKEIVIERFMEELSKLEKG